MRDRLIVLPMLLASALFLSSAPATSQVSFSIGVNVPGVSIGINVPAYPQLVPVPGYPVYYAPRVESNYFFYDGMYWVYQQDNWYASYWYDGPWGIVAPQAVPVYILRIPVRYYRRPPPYFHGWRPEAPPRWGERWGHEWERDRNGWDRWDRRSSPRPAPLPTYQRQYTGPRYPSAEKQPELHSRNYRYQPREPVVREHYQAQRAIAPPRAAQSKQGTAHRGADQDQQRYAPAQPQQQGPDRGSQGKGRDQGRGHDKGYEKGER